MESLGREGPASCDQEQPPDWLCSSLGYSPPPLSGMEREVGRMRSAWISLAAGSGTVGLAINRLWLGVGGGGVRSAGTSHAPLLLSVWSGADSGSRQPAGAYSLVKGKSSSRGKRFKLQGGYETWIVPMPDQWCGPEPVPEPARRV